MKPKTKNNTRGKTKLIIWKIKLKLWQKHKLIYEGNFKSLNMNHWDYIN